MNDFFIDNNCTYLEYMKNAEILKMFRFRFKFMCVIHTNKFTAF